MTYRDSTCPGVIVNGLVHSEVDISDRITKKVGALRIGVVLGDQIIVGGYIFSVCVGRPFQVGHPLGL